MFNIIKKIINDKKEIRNLKYQIEALKCDIRHSLSIVERYLPLMKTPDKIQLLILRKNLFRK